MTKLLKIAFTGVLALGIAAGSASPAAAQGQQFGVGYQFVRFGGVDLSYPLGFNIDYSYPLVALPISIVGEFGWSRHSDDPFTSNLLNFGAGGRYTVPLEGTVTPYVQVIFGAQHDSDSIDDEEVFSDTSFMWQPGGGVAFPLNDRWDLFGQIDFRQVMYEGDSEWGSPRLFIGGRLGL